MRQSSSALRGAMALIALLALAACSGIATSPSRSKGDVSYTSLEPQDAQRHELGEDEDFHLGDVLPDNRALPVYPATRLGEAANSVAVCVELHVDEKGRVADTSALEDSDDCPSLAQGDEPFRSAVDLAVRQWAFEPSVVCRLRDADVADGTCSEAASVEPVALLRGYRFVFRQTAAGPVVTGDER